MENREPYRDEKLPVTAEVGGEGGSFAEPTYQQSAEKGVRGEAIDHVDPKAHDVAAGAVSHDANRRDEIAAGGVGDGPGPADGMKKPVTE